MTLGSEYPEEVLLPRGTAHRYHHCAAWGTSASAAATISQATDTSACVSHYSILSQGHSLEKHPVSQSMRKITQFHFGPSRKYRGAANRTRIISFIQDTLKGVEQNCRHNPIFTALTSLETLRAATLKGLIHPLQYFW